MKKIIAMAFAAITLAACNETSTHSTTADTPDTATRVTEPPSAINNTAYNPVNGDVTRRDGKVMVMRDGTWVEADDDVRMENGVVVNRKGRVRREGKEIELEEGEIVNRTGDFFDRTGKAIENAWDKTKEGVKKAGKEVGEAARKVGDKAEDAVDNDNNKH